MKRRISDGQKRLMGYINGVIHKESRKVRRVVPCSDIRHWIWRTTPQSQLEHFFQSQNGDVRSKQVINGFWNPSRSLRESGAYPLVYYSETPLICPECGHLDVIGHGPREGVWRGLIPRWNCKLCGKTFNWDVVEGFKSPLWLWDTVISHIIKGDEFRRINEAVIGEASKRGLDINSVSSNAVYSIIKRSREILGEFEKFSFRNLTEQQVKLKTVEIDFTTYTLYTPRRGGKQITLKRRTVNYSKLTKSQAKILLTKPVTAYLTGTIDEESRYGPSMVTGRGFKCMYSLLCLRRMLNTVGSKPEVIKCDGFKGHVRAVERFLPDVKLISKTKREDFGIVNYIEALWREFKTECLHEGRFRSFNTLQHVVELKRLEHNLLRPHTSLDGLTPAEFLGIKIPRSIVESREGKWGKLLKLAHTMVKIESSVRKRRKRLG